MSDIFLETIKKLCPGFVNGTSSESLKKSNVQAIESILQKSNVTLEAFLAEAAVVAKRNLRSLDSRQVRDALTFQISNRPESELVYTENSSTRWSLEANTIRDCVVSANKAIELLHDVSQLYSVILFETLGLRNLSSFIGVNFRTFCKHLSCSS